MKKWVITLSQQQEGKWSTYYWSKQNEDEKVFVIVPLWAITYDTKEEAMVDFNHLKLIPEFTKDVLEIKRMEVKDA